MAFHRGGPPLYLATLNLPLSKNLPYNTVGFPGTIDEVGLWGMVLSAAEVTSLYDSGSGSTFPFASGGNIPPTAIAGINQFLNAWTTSTTLSGTGSDIEGTVASYAWTQTAGPTVGVIINPSRSTTM
jgi:hypothetical protein